MLWLLLLLGALEAATLKVEGVNESLLVYVDGHLQGRCPLVLDLGDGRYALEFKKEEWQVASVRYGLAVAGQSKGKLTVDWVRETVDVVWAEDLVAAKQAEQARLEEQRRAEDAARRAEQARLEAAQEQKRLAAEEAAKAEAKGRYMPHREVGVAAMKEGDRRTALQAFRASREAGDDDARIKALIAKLEGEMGSVRLRITGAKSGVPLEISLDTPEGEPFEPSSQSRGRWTFVDVPIDVPIELRVSGPGYPSVVVAVDPLSSGQRADANAELAFFGQATLVLTDLPDTIRVTVTDPAASHAASQPGELRVTAGPLTIALDGPSGQREISVEVEDGSTTTFAVMEKMPGAMVLEGLPAGCSLALVEAPEGSTLSRAETDRGDVRQVQGGVGIAAPLRLEGLLPGDHELAIDHPVLGSTSLRFAPVPGETSHLAILWETMSGATAVKAAREDWERRLALSKEVPRSSKLGWIAAGGTAAVAATSALFGVQALGARSDLRSNEASYTQALANDDGESAWSLYASQVDLKRSLRSNTAFSIGGLGITAACAGVSVVLFGQGKQQRSPVEAWDLWSLDASQPQPALEEDLDAPVEPEAAEPSTTPVEE